MGAQRTPRAIRESGAGCGRGRVLAMVAALMAIAGGCGPESGGRSTDVAERAVDIGGGAGIRATDAAPGEVVDPATAVAGLGAAGATDVAALDGNIEVVDVSDADIEELLDATRSVFFSRGTIEEMCEAPELFPDKITGGPQVVVSDDVRLASKAVVVVLGFPPGSRIDVRVAAPNSDDVAAIDLEADGNGCAVGRWIVSPNSAPGDYVALATDGNIEAIHPVTIAAPDGPTLIVSPNEVVAGEDVAVSLAGYEPGTRPRIVLYALGSGAACGKYAASDCWIRRAAWRTSATDARGGVVVRLPTGREDPRGAYLVTTIPRPHVFPRDVQNTALMFTIVDERSEVAP